MVAPNEATKGLATLIATAACRAELTGATEGSELRTGSLEPLVEVRIPARQTVRGWTSRASLWLRRCQHLEPRKRQPLHVGQPLDGRLAQPLARLVRRYDQIVVVLERARCVTEGPSPRACATQGGQLAPSLCRLSGQDINRARDDSSASLQMRLRRMLRFGIAGSNRRFKLPGSGSGRARARFAVSTPS